MGRITTFCGIPRARIVLGKTYSINAVNDSLNFRRTNTSNDYYRRIIIIKLYATTSTLYLSSSHSGFHATSSVYEKIIKGKTELA
jgi:hypothetical protein